MSRRFAGARRRPASPLGPWTVALRSSRVDYYGRFGFCHFDQPTYAHAPAYALQALPFGDLVPEGEVTFHDAFDATAETVAIGS